MYHYSKVTPTKVILVSFLVPITPELNIKNSRVIITCFYNVQTAVINIYIIAAVP